MELKGEILLIPDKPDIERDQIAAVWVEFGGEVKRVGKFWLKPETGNSRVSLYGYDTFCLVLAQILELEMLMPKDEWIVGLPAPFLKRSMQLIARSQIAEVAFPAFLKPVTPKLFKAQTFHSVDEFIEVVGDIEEAEKLICSDVIQVDQEVRSFILDREIKDAAFYEGTGNLEEAKAFISQFLSASNLPLPKTFVIDIGFNKKDGWFVIEFNSSWGAGLNSCDPRKVIECIREAVVL